MNKTLRDVALMLVALLTACSGGGGGISGTGVVTGTVTGFGSVKVNEIEFTRRPGLADNRVTFAFDDSVHGESDLKVGMIVTVRGDFDSTAGTGGYDSITYTPELRGPIDAGSGSVDAVNGTLTVLGRTVKVNGVTIFGGFATLSELQPNNLMEISGYLDDTGLFLAARVERKGTSFSPGGEVKLKGVITGTAGNSFTIGSQTVTYDPNFPSLLVNLSKAEISAGVLVDARGTFEADGSITANRIEKLDAVDGAATNDKLRVKGLVITAGSGNFLMSGPNGPLTVQVSGATVFDKGTSANIVAGATLEVEGIVNAAGALAASRVSFEGDATVRLEGNVAQAADIDLPNGTLRLNGVTVVTDALTRFRDNRDVPTGPSPTFGLSEVSAGDHLNIVGFANGTGSIAASQVERFNASSRTFIQGGVTSVALPNLTILNITVVTSPSGTSFQDASETAITQSAFFAALAPNRSVVKASGTFVPPGTIDPATEVEIEP